MKRNDGFSLLEIVISLAISGIVIVGTIAAFRSAARVNIHAEQDLTAQLQVQNAVEYVLTYGWNETWRNGNTWSSEAPSILRDVIFEMPQKTGNHYKVTLKSGNVSVSTNVRDVTPTPDPNPEGGEG